MNLPDPIGFADERLQALPLPSQLSDSQRLYWRRLALASDFAMQTLQRQPELMTTIAAADSPLPVLHEDPAQTMSVLRRWRAAASTRLIWRDIAGIDSVDATLCGSTAIAEQALAFAYQAALNELQPRFGVVRDAQGQRSDLVVFGLGKLGGSELNFSSDVDLVYAYPHGGSSDGPRSIDAETWFTRFGQRLAQLLSEMTADGFSHRVDLRLRPFGNAGRIALSFSAMEEYFQRDGRDWERYAWIKARSVAGDFSAGEKLLEILRPFVYRRYLDFTALDGLREMKALIAAEVKRKDLADDIKRGPGGIREIEFFVQSLQLIRGGREPLLRQRGLVASLQVLADAGHVSVGTQQQLLNAYRFLRRLENRLQMFDDAQTHQLPDDLQQRWRIALGMGYPDIESLLAELAEHRSVVMEQSDGLLQAPKRRQGNISDALVQYWRALPDQADAQLLIDAGIDDAQALHQQLCTLASTGTLQSLSLRGRARFDAVLPAILAAAAQQPRPAVIIRHSLALLQAITKRTSYLALLQEQPSALQRLVRIAGSSALLVERLVAHPLLLDELLDLRAAGPVPNDESISQIIEHTAQVETEDTEQLLTRLNEVRHSLDFRLGLALHSERINAGDCAQRLAHVAEVIVQQITRIATAQIEQAHGRIAGTGLAVIGYGSIGGNELGFASDLDLVFLHNADPNAMSDGARPLEAARFFARLAQKIVALLSAVTAGGKLYEVDVRLRPDGTQGMLVSTLASFAAYQNERAWLWEKQALVRARALAGDADLCQSFETIRQQTLTQPRDPAAVSNEIIAMRQKMATQLDRSNAQQFDLKQGSGGIVDIEFLLQAIVLRHAATASDLCRPRASTALFDAIAAGQWLQANDIQQLRMIHQQWLMLGLECTLDRRPRLVENSVEIDEKRHTVRSICCKYQLDFEYKL